MPDEADKIACFLPGLVDHGQPAVMSDAQISRLPVFTAEGLAQRDPEKYARCRALFFGAGLSQRQICCIERVSYHTLSALILRESRGADARQWNLAMQGDVRAITAQGMSVARELLADPKAVKKAGLRGVAALLHVMRDVAEVIEGRIPAHGADGDHDCKAAAADYLRAARSKPIEAEEIGTSGDRAKAVASGHGEAKHD